MEQFQIQFNDRYSILIISCKGILRKVQCPFKVSCYILIGSFEPGVEIYVSEVFSNTKGELMYMIMGRHYHYRYFRLEVSF